MPFYDDYIGNILKTAQNLGSQPFQPYTGQMFAPFSNDQQQSFQDTRDLNSNVAPYLSGAFNTVSGANPNAGVTASQPFMNAATGTPTGYDAGSGMITGAAGAWPGAASSYVNPYINNAVNAANQLTTQNFTQNVMPALNSQFIASGGGLGSKQYGDTANWALTNFNNSVNNATQTALANNYNNLYNQFATDQSRALNAGTNLGALANQTAQTQGQLGQTAANINNSAFGNAINQGESLGHLGASANTIGLQNAGALNQMGQQQQQQAQNPLSFDYQQWQQGVQWPYQMVQFMNQAQQGLTLPMQGASNQSSYNTQQMTGGGGSVLGNILGGLTSIGSMAVPGAGGISALGNIFGGMGSLFGSGVTDAGATAAGASATAAAPYMGAIPWKRGGRVDYAAGGYAPTVRASLENLKRETRGAKNRPALAQLTGSTPRNFARGGYADGGHARRIPTTFDVRDPSTLAARPSMPRVSARKTARDWRDFAEQFPIGFSHGIGSMVGFPGTMYDIATDSAEPSALSGDRINALIDRGWDKLYGGTSFPESTGGDAGRIAGGLATLASLRAAPKAASLLGRLAQKGLGALNASAVPDIVGEDFPSATRSSTDYLDRAGLPSLMFGRGYARGGALKRLSYA